MLHLEKIGLRERYSFSKIKNVMSLPNLIDIQKASYKWFLEKGLKEVFDDVSPITDYSGNMILEFIDYSLDGEPKYDVEECKERDANYSTSLQVRIRLIIKDKETGEVSEGKVQSVYVSDFPVMTPTGTFVVNGAERVIVSQLVRSPGAYYTMEIDKHGTNLYSTQVIPSRGAWLEYETDSLGVTYARVDRTRKLPITSLIRALGIGTNEEIIDYFGAEPRILATIEKDVATTCDEGVIEIYRRLRPGEPLVVENARSLFESMFFDPRRYDLMHVGRYKLNKKLSLAARLAGQTLAEDVVSPLSGEVLYEAGTQIDQTIAQNIQNSGVNRVLVKVGEEKSFPIVGNGTVDVHAFALDFDIDDLNIDEKVNFRALKEIMERDDLNQKEKRELFKDSLSLLIPKIITPEDVFASISYNLGLEYGIGETDDIDHLGNRRLRSVGELLQNQFRIGLSRLERVVRERMAALDPDALTPQALVNIKPVNSAIKDFFSSSQLSQFMDQTNPLSELTNKRRLSALGPGGLSRERASFDVRDVHHSHYGRICPIETPEGPNIGLIGALSTYARVNKYGFIETPYIKVVDGHIAKDENGNEIIQYIDAEEEGLYTIAQANEPIDENGRFVNERVSGRRGKQRDFVTVEPSLVDYMDISPRQIVSVATALIPFLENDDANRALMGANMQRQAVPLLIPQAPIVATGMEHRAAKDSGVCIVSEIDGTVTRVAAQEIVVTGEDGTVKRYPLIKFKRSNQGTCLNQHPIVKLGQKVSAGEIIADGPSTEKGDLALGRNVLVGYMTWEGYNYEDAILISEKIVKEDIYTSIHIEEFEVEARDTKLGPEEITRDIAQLSEETLKNLDEEGVIRIGAEVRSDDILVGKVTPKGETELTAEEKLLRAIFGEKAREVRDTSLRVPHGEGGIVVDVKVFTKENGDDLKPGVNKLVRVYLAVKRKISVGDKMAGRHGNKGVISRILPEEDMPFLPDGTPLDIVLSPLGVPSRMNIGQVLETHLGWACKALGIEIATPVFDGANENDIMELLKKAGLDEDGKVWLRDGRSGEYFDNRVTVGYSYMLKLHHLVDDKMHARSTGPYSLVTQQPLGGKAQFGGQRFGEMEVWALEAYGAANVLQEILTVKSDDVVGRVKAYEAIVKSENIPQPGIPESFKVLIKEFQSLGLDINVLGENGEVIDIKDTEEDSVRPPRRAPLEEDSDAFPVDEDELSGEGFLIEEDDADDLLLGAEAEDDEADVIAEEIDDFLEDDEDSIIERIARDDLNDTQEF